MPDAGKSTQAGKLGFRHVSLLLVRRIRQADGFQLPGATAVLAGVQPGGPGFDVRMVWRHRAARELRLVEPGGDLEAVWTRTELPEMPAA